MAALRGGEFDVILLDLALPNSDGIESFCSVGEQSPDPLILVLSGTRNERAGMQAVRAVAEFDSVKNLLQRIIQTVCDTLTWEFGAFWVPEPNSQVLRCLVSWQQPGAQVDQFKLMSERIQLAGREGVPGRVWADGRPLWIPDIVDNPSFPRPACARTCGLHAAFAAPVKAGRQVMGVMEFYNREISQPDGELLVRLSVIGSELGQLIQRKHAEETLKVTLEEFSQSNRELRRFAEEFSGRRRNALEPAASSTAVSDAASGRGRSRKTRVATGEAGSLQNPD